MKAWLVENDKKEPDTLYRTMESGNIVWINDINKAIRFCRRIDAEMFAEEDEEAWFIREHSFTK